MNQIIAHYRSNDGVAQSVENHLLGVSNLARNAGSKIGLAAYGELVGLLHDFGKYSQQFDKYLQSAVGLIGKTDSGYLNPTEWKGKIDHSTAGAQWIWEHFNSGDSLQCLAREILALCICSHHGGLIDCLGIDGIDTLLKRLEKEADKTYYHEACRLADYEVLRHAKCIGEKHEYVLQLRQLITLINNGTEYQKLRVFWMGLLVRYLFSCLIDADRTDTADFESPENTVIRSYGKYPHWGSLVSRFEQYISEFSVDSEMNMKRMEISKACLSMSGAEKKLFYLTVPTGGGKTLASMRFALHHARKHELDRIIYVIPYTSIIEQNAQEIRNIFVKDASFDIGEIVLEHHSNLHDKHDTKRNRLLSENWDAPIVFTTSVQLLDALFGGGTRGARRMHQLARAVIIFDEVQTQPINTIHLFNNAVNFLMMVCSSTIVFCTATQPLLHAVDPKNGAVPYHPEMEMVLYESLFKGFRRIEVRDAQKIGGWTVEAIGVEIKKQLDELGSVLFIANTKRDAKRVFAATEGLAEHRYHLSTSMCPTHRLEILKRVKICLRRKWPVVCVSTQLVEAGVNLDFGCVFRALAGLDSIAQAAGRCNRNNKREYGRVLIVNLNGENLGKLPEIHTAQQETLRVLDEYNKSPEMFDHDLISPKAIERYYEYYFYQRAGEMAYKVKAKDFGRDDTLLSLLSTNSLSVKEAKRTGTHNTKRILNQAFKSAGKYFKVIDAPTQGILVHYGGFGKTKGEATRLIHELGVVTDFQEQTTLLKKVQRYSVNIFPHDLDKLDKAGALHETQPGSGIWYLDKDYYCSKLGVCTEQVGEMEFLNI